MSDPVFGISITRVDNEPRPAIGADMAVLGLVGTAPDANPTTFPLNTPVLVYSSDTSIMQALGPSGTLPGAIAGGNDQLGEFQVAAKVVVVRVEQGVDTDATMSNIIGSSTSKTGIHALPTAGPLLGVIPRLIGVPGFTHQHWKGLTAIVPGTQGSGLSAAPTVVFTGGGNDPKKRLPAATATLGSGADAGKVVGYTITDPGAYLSGGLTVSFTGGGGGSPTLPTATAVVEHLANPVVAALPAVLNKLLAHAVVLGPADSQQAFTDWRETIQSGRIIAQAISSKVGVTPVVEDPVARILALGAAVDHEHGGMPFHSWANRPLHGIVGPNRAVDFSLTDGATEGQALLGLNGGIIVRGEAGVETAIASGGFIYIGTDTCSDNTLWQFYNQSRGRDYIHLTFLRTLRFYLGRFNLNKHTIQAIRNTMEFALRDLKAGGHILGYKVDFVPDQNSPEELRKGRFYIGFAAEEPAPLRYLGIQSTRYRPALDALLSDLLAQVDVAA